MLKKLLVSSLATFASVEAGSQEAQCQGLTTDSGTVFNIHQLSSTDGYSHVVDGHPSQTLHWNYCTFVEGAASIENAYAYIAVSQPEKEIAIATNEIPRLAQNERDTNGATIGVTFTQSSDSVCYAPGSSTKSSFALKTVLLCDDSITAAAKIESVFVDGCTYTATLKHSEGCADIAIDIDQALGWLGENEWAIGIIYLVVGPLIALFGLKFFPIVTAGVTALFVMIMVIYVCMAAGWMAGTGACVAVFIVALNLGIIAGCIIKRYFWLMVGMLGFVGGFFAGGLVYAVIYGCTGWKELWGYWLIGATFAILGTWASCTMGKTVVLVSTALIGSYLFMRSWTLFFAGHYPSEAEIADADIEEDLAVDPVFWIFIGIFVTCFLGSMCFQYKQGHDDEDLYEYHRAKNQQQE